MLRVSTIIVSVIFFIILSISRSTFAEPIMVSLWDLTEKSNVVFTGRVLEVGKDSAAIEVTEVLSGKLDSKTAVVTPVTIEYDFGMLVNFKNDEKVLIYAGKSDNGQIIVTASGHGKIALEQNNEKTEIAAAKRIIAIASLKSENEKNLAMITEAKSSNKRLQSEARTYISIKISHSEQRKNYEKELINLINDSNSVIQRIGLEGIRFVKAKEAFPRIVELAHSEDINVVSQASQALAGYESPESEKALIELTKHKDPQIRIRACIDLSISQLPESKEALEHLLYDENPKVRAMAPRGLVYWLRADKADDVLPRLEEMLNDPSAEVRAAAAQHLGESRNSSVVKYLIEAIKKYPQDTNMKRWIFQALEQHSVRDKTGIRALKDEDINLIIDALKNGEPTDSFGPSFYAVGILSFLGTPEAKEALRWAAESHPNKNVKSYAARCIAK